MNTPHQEDYEIQELLYKDKSSDCLKCLAPIDPSCEIGNGHPAIEEQSKSIFEVLWRDCTSRAFESKKRRDVNNNKQ